MSMPEITRMKKMPVYKKTLLAGLMLGLYCIANTSILHAGLLDNLKSKGKTVTRHTTDKVSNESKKKLNQTTTNAGLSRNYKKYTVQDVAVDSTPKEADQILVKKGFVKSKSKSNATRQIYVKKVASGSDKKLTLYGGSYIYKMVFEQKFPKKVDMDMDVIESQILKKYGKPDQARTGKTRRTFQYWYGKTSSSRNGLTITVRTDSSRSIKMEAHANEVAKRDKEAEKKRKKLEKEKKLKDAGKKKPSADIEF